MNWIKKMMERRRERKQLRQLKDFVQVFGTLERLEKTGMLWFDVKNRRLFLEQPLAVVMMAGGAEKWTAFLQNCFLWLYHRQCSEAWDAYIRKEELKAVRRTVKKYPLMTRQDVERVKRARREEIGRSDAEPPKVAPFEFFVIREKNNPTEQTDGQAVPSGEVMVVGNYDPETGMVEVATWEEVKMYLEGQKK